MRHALLAMFLFTAAAAGFTQAGCKGKQTSSSFVDGAKARELVSQGALLLDVRTPMEYSRGHIDGAVNIPLSELGRNLDQLKKDQPIVIYCQSGNRSGQARGFLAGQGYQAYDLGGMYNW